MGGTATALEKTRPYRRTLAGFLLIVLGLFAMQFSGGGAALLAGGASLIAVGAAVVLLGEQKRRRLIGGRY